MFNKNEDLMPVSGAEVKKKKSVGIIAGVCAVVIVAGGLLAYNLVPVVKNTVRMAVMQPENYFSTVETENLRKLSNDIAENYRKSYDYYQADSLGADMNISAKLAEPYEISDGMTIDNAGIKANVAMNKDILSEDISVSINDTSVMDISAVADLVGNQMFMKLSGLSDDFINIDSEGTGIDFSAFTSSISYDYITPEQVENILNKYGDVLIENLEGNEITLEKGAEGDSAGVSYKYNKICIDISDKKANEIAIAFLESLKDDEEIKDIYDTYIETYEEIEGYDEVDFETAIDEEIDSLKSDMETDSDEPSATFAVYVDAEGTIRGHEIYDDETTVGYSMAKDGNSYGLEFSVNDNDEEMSVKVNATEANDAFTGTLNIVIPEEEANLSIGFEDIKMENEAEGLVSGKLSMDLSSFDESLSTVTLTLSAEDSTQKLSLDIPEYVEISMDYSLVKNPEVATVPDSSISIDEIDYEKQEQLIKDIFDKLGWDYESAFGGYDDTDYSDYEYDDTDYDDAEDYDTSSDYDDFDYDLSTADIKIGGNSVLMPAAMPEIYNLLGNDANSYVYEFGENTCLACSGDDSLNLIFNSTSDNLSENTPVGYISYNHIMGNTPLVDISVNGVTTGSTVSSVAQAFGLDEQKLTSSALSNDEYTVYLNDGNYYIGLTITDGAMVSGIEVSYSDEF